MPRRPKAPPTEEPEPKKRRERNSGRLYFDASKDRWVAALTVDGRLVRRLFRTEPEAVAGLAALHADAAAQRIDLTRQTLADFIAEWLADHILPHRSHRTVGPVGAQDALQLHARRLDGHLRALREACHLLALLILRGGV